MKHLRTVTLAAIAALALAPAVMASDEPHDKAIDREGRPIMDERGNCVQTKWHTANDICGAKAPVATPAKKEALKLTREERTVYFDFNKSTIKASEQGKLNSLIKALRDAKEVESVDIVGHTDRIGSNSYNDKLSRKRANAVRAYLARHGAGIKVRKVDVEGVGKNDPVTHCGDLPRAELIKCLAEDRRVEIRLNYAK